MSKRARSEAELKQIAFVNCDRVLVVHCGYCKDENGKEDRRNPIGWLGRIFPGRGFVHGWFVFDRVKGEAWSQRLECTRCKRWLVVGDSRFDGLLLGTFRDRKRITLKVFAEHLIERPYVCTVDDLEGLQLLGNKALVASVVDTYRDEYAGVDDDKEQARGYVETSLRRLAALQGHDEYEYVPEAEE